MKGINNQILRVDLSKQSYKVEQKEDQFYRKYLGGRGFGLFYMINEIPPDCSPFAPENLLVFASSIIGGTPGPAIPRLTVCSKSPLTEAFGESEAGGFWAPELKKAGFDAVVIKGRAKHPVYLWIDDGDVKFRDAGDIWGMVTGEAEKEIKKDLGSEDVKIAQIGPGGENLVRYAGIVNELAHFNGRNGLGAVMGSKNLKAIAVKGSDNLPVSDPEKLKEINKWTAREGMKKPIAKTLHEYGTPAGVAPFNEMGQLPTNNWNKGTFSGAENLSGENMKKTIGKKPKGCYACPIRCKRVVEVNEENMYVDPKYGGPEYESLAALGSLLGIDDIEVVAKLNEVCNKNTLDTISTGMTIGFVIECYREGVIKSDDIDGLEPEFGDEEAVFELLDKIIYREGAGDLLAEGSFRTAEAWGEKAMKLVKEVKKQEVPMHDPRFKTGLGLQYALANYGADHMYAAHDSYYEDENSPGLQTTEGLGIYMPVEALEMGNDKVSLFIKLSLYWTLIDMLGACYFGFVPRGPIPLEKLIEIVKAVTGADITLYEMMKAAERSINMARVYNLREGFTGEDDYLPDVFFEDLCDGPREGEGGLDRGKFAEMVEKAYKLMGWDEKGRPAQEKLNELGLSWIDSY